MRRKCLFASLVVGVAVVACGGTEKGEAGLLPRPPAGSGFQVTTGDFAFDPGTEVQDCYFYKVRDLAALGGMPADKPVYYYYPKQDDVNCF